jgi:hypothetical protein
MKHIKLFEQFITEKQSVITATGLSKEIKQTLVGWGCDVKSIGPGYYITVDDTKKKKVIDYLKQHDIETNESKIDE